jgi:hypothetical protein
LSKPSTPPVAEGLEPISAMLARVGMELEAVVVMIHGLEDVVGHAISSARSPEEIQIEELQELDHVRQKIEGSAAFLKALTTTLPAEWLIDPTRAAGSVGMSALARRLGGGGAHEAPEDLIELF